MIKNIRTITDFFSHFNSKGREFFLKLENLFKCSVSPNLFKSVWTLITQNVGILLQILAVTILFKGDSSKILFERIANYSNIKIQISYEFLLLAATGSYILGEWMRFIGKSESVKLIKEYMRAILLKLSLIDGSEQISGRQLSIAFRCSVMMRRLLDAIPLIVIIFYTGALIVISVHIYLIAALLFSSIVLLFYQLSIARSSAILQAKIIKNTKRHAVNRAKTIEQCIKNAEMYVAKRILIFKSGFCTGVYTLLLIILLVLFEGFNILYNFSLLVLFYIFGNSMRSLLISLTSAARLYPALQQFANYSPQPIVGSHVKNDFIDEEFL